jgi:maltooligosyltrehalose trehalohydrolase
MSQVIRVWAPLPKKVEVQSGKKAFPLTRQPNGWWTGSLPTPAAQTDYGFLLDGEGPFPDPRSSWQPHGIHGLSRVVDHSSFSWTDQKWQAPPLSSAIIYELHIGTFTVDGTFQAAIEKLDHLTALGVTHVELMPVNEFSGSRGWGYDGVDLFAPHHAYGGPIGLKQFVDACHARRLAVLLDVVYNHLGPAGNYLGKFAPYFNPHYSSPWGPALNFDGPDSEEVRRFFCDNALMWLRDYHMDGVRLDAVHAIVDTSAEPFLEQLGLEVRQLEAQLRHRFVVIAESDLNDPRLLWSRDRGGFALDAQWSDDFHHSLYTVLTGEKTGYYEDFGTLADLARALQHAFVYDGRYSIHRRRRHGRRFADLSGQRFLGYLQNHDQIGNRAQGDRLSQKASLGQLQIGAALVLTAPFVPMLFQGEEWGAKTPFLYFTDHQEPDLANAVRDGRRKEFVAFNWKPEDIPDPQALETFQHSKLNWREMSGTAETALLEWYRRLVRLRSEQPALADGRLENVHVRFDEETRWLVVQRGTITIVCNFRKAAQSIPLPSARRTVLLSTGGEKVTAAAVQLPAEAVVILISGDA